MGQLTICSLVVIAHFEQSAYEAVISAIEQRCLGLIVIKYYGRHTELFSSELSYSSEAFAGALCYQLESGLLDSESVIRFVIGSTVLPF